MGAGIGSRPEEWVTALGNEFDENRLFESSLSRDFGFVVADFSRENELWACHLVILQVHKLDMAIEGWQPLPEVVRARYGAFPKRVVAKNLTSALVEASLSIYRVADEKLAELENLWIPEANVGISVIRDPEFAQSEEKSVGDVYSMYHSPAAVIDADRLIEYH
ncbi:hypothetical protein [Crossiella sp. CA198]|uniref:hypothetical protein n=1 Tax=Crossiella sp. CA198 TaxID=3455607 RepID=UPI003F8D729E